jgi:hypothetical protein
MNAKVQSSTWRAFQRRCFADHAEAWMLAQVPLWWWALLDDVATKSAVDVSLVIASGVAAVVLASWVALAAALLRLPWWLLWPLCWLSMGVEWWLRCWTGRPWLRTRVRERWYLSNPVPLWQRLWLRWRRSLRRAARRMRPIASAWQRWRARLGRPTRRRPLPTYRLDDIGPSAWDYASDFVSVYAFSWWCVGFVVLWVGLAIETSLDWLFALLVTIALFALGSAILVVPLACMLLGFVTALWVGAFLSPAAREAAIRRAYRGVPPTVPPFGTADVGLAPVHATQPKSSTPWWVVLALGMILGSAMADDD